MILPQSIVFLHILVDFQPEYCLFRIFDGEDIMPYGLAFHDLGLIVYCAFG